MWSSEQPWGFTSAPAEAGKGCGKGSVHLESDDCGRPGDPSPTPGRAQAGWHCTACFCGPGVRSPGCLSPPQPPRSLPTQTTTLPSGPAWGEPHWPLRGSLPASHSARAGGSRKSGLDPKQLTAPPGRPCLGGLGGSAARPQLRPVTRVPPALRDFPGEASALRVTRTLSSEEHGGS